MILTFLRMRSNLAFVLLLIITSLFGKFSHEAHIFTPSIIGTFGEISVLNTYQTQRQVKLFQTINLDIVEKI